jgi:hypothetical protein
MGPPATRPAVQKMRRGRNLSPPTLVPPTTMAASILVLVTTTEAHNVAHVEERARAWPG